MTKKQLTESLLRIAAKIDNSLNPNKESVIRDLKAVLATSEQRIWKTTITISMISQSAEPPITGKSTEEEYDSVLSVLKANQFRSGKTSAIINIEANSETMTDEDLVKARNDYNLNIDPQNFGVNIDGEDNVIQETEVVESPTGGTCALCGKNPCQCDYEFK